MEYDGGYSVRENDVYNLGNVIIGNFSGTEIEGFFAFQLPDLDGESFQSAKLNFEFPNNSGEPVLLIFTPIAFYCKCH